MFINNGHLLVLENVTSDLVVTFGLLITHIESVSHYLYIHWMESIFIIDRHIYPALHI